MKRLSSLLAISLVTLAGCASDATSPDSDTPPGDDDQAGTELPASAVAQIEALIAEKAAWSPTQRKISSHLLYAKNGRFAARYARP
ncbi:MAG: hypothetical protein HC855_16270 [Rhizobiales bacterium]|nr:hypothetical protein [Hyphomicrobiales bacterium]